VPVVNLSRLLPPVFLGRRPNLRAARLTTQFHYRRTRLDVDERQHPVDTVAFSVRGSVGHTPP
jgi:hypothetical protein